ncbi:alpha/beta hydrolase [Actinoalloteichus hymeniacidonis]|uniref:Esterase n=1 Tax=Actinoalloteichus hymeniacidonis TaxID=340345 RepID=A0AAC9HQI2_9PSEU|nr:alpha/beta hydrolase [Actinoalloteichus hymeniacidonis]AOS63565.1 putative esterase [Actinoalloteichus hymeniacidonis]MBB5908389.1 phospholipase/carboxylesterase [Actinoalloteichus hymeniacidonis]
MTDSGSPLHHRFHPGSPDAPVFLLLHGTGGGPEDLVEPARALDPRASLLAPSGPVRERGAARWFRRLAEGVFDFADVEVRARHLADFLDHARDRHDLADRRVVAIGFSNGANIAAATALLRPDSLREAVLFSAMMPLAADPVIALADTRILASNGSVDPLAPAAEADRLIETLRANGAEVSVHRHPGGHPITAAGMAAAREWLTKPNDD